LGLLRSGPERGPFRSFGRRTLDIAQFVRTGPPVEVKKEWWVTRSYPIPAGLLKNGPIEIRFTDPGIAIAAVALSVERVPNSGSSR
jgi:hypothetical protein